MSALPSILTRLDQLIESGRRIPQVSGKFGNHVAAADWNPWIASALNLAQFAFGESSIYFRQLQQLTIDFKSPYGSAPAAASGPRILEAAKFDLQAGLIGSLEKRLSGEIFADFLGLAKNALNEGQKDVAAVLACAALEDTLKKFATLNGLDVDGKTLDNVVGALKGAGLLTGASKGLIGPMPKIRNHAMHAEWDKISAPDVAGVTSFTEQFLLSNMC